MDFLSITGASAVLPLRNEWTNEVPASIKRRDPRIWQMAYVAASRAVDKNTIMPNSVVVATALGALDETKSFLDGIYNDGFGSPRNFIASVHNSMAGKLALEFKISGPNLTFCDGCNSFSSAIAACGLLSAVDFPSLVIAVDENIDLLNCIIPNLSIPCKQALCDNKNEGAIAFVVDYNPESIGCKIRSTGSIYIGNRNPDAAFKDNVSMQKDITTPDMILPSQNQGSYISSAVRVLDFVNNASSGRALIGSFSPSSNAVSIIELCR